MLGNKKAQSGLLRALVSLKEKEVKVSQEAFDTPHAAAAPAPADNRCRCSSSDVRGVGLRSFFHSSCVHILAQLVPGVNGARIFAHCAAGFGNPAGAGTQLAPGVNGAMIFARNAAGFGNPAGAGTQLVPGVNG